MRGPLVVLAIFTLSGVARAGQITGFVTTLTPPAAIQLDGRSVNLTPATRLCIRTKGAGASKDSCPENVFASSSASFSVGEALEISGTRDHSSRVFTAARITVILLSPARVGDTAMIDFVPSAQPADPAERMVRADGYLLHITAKTKTELRQAAQVHCGSLHQSVDPVLRRAAT